MHRVCALHAVSWLPISDEPTASLDGLAVRLQLLLEAAC